MKREITDRNVLNEFCKRFTQIVEQYCRYIIVSGFVAIASGRTRGTEDIDLIMERVSRDMFGKLFAALKKEGFACMQSDDADEVYDYLTENLSVRFTEKEKPLPEMEVKFAKDELDEYQLRTRIKLPLTNLDVWFSDINVNIAFKEELLKSPKDLEDAWHLRIVFSEMVDEEKIKKVKELIRRLRL